MSKSKINYFDLVDVRGGMLVSQLYNRIPLDSRPSYATFLKDVRNTKGLYVAPAVGLSKSLYVTTDKRIISNPAKFNIKVEKFNIMLYAFEEQLGRSLMLYREDELWVLYDAFRATFPGLIRLDETQQWLSEYGSLKRSFASNSAQVITAEKPGFSLLNLHRRNIHVEILPQAPVKLRFYFFDTNNDINRNDFVYDVAAVLDFAQYHHIQFDFEIVAVCWSDIRADLMEKHFSVSKSLIAKIPAPKTFDISKTTGQKALSTNSMVNNYKDAYLDFLKRVRFVSVDANPLISRNLSKVA